MIERSIGKWRIGAVLAAAGITTSCASSEPAAAVDGFAVHPIARYVLDDRASGDQELFYDWLNRDEVEYDEYFRSPLWPLGATVADCDKTSRIGIAFRLASPGAKYLRYTNRQRPLKFEWTLPSQNGGTRTVTYFRTTYFRYFVAGIRLDPRRKVDGIYKVSVQLLGIELYQTSFELFGCNDGPDHPLWYEPITGARRVMPSSISASR